MYLKRRKGNKPLWIGIAVILLITFITYHQEKGLIKANFEQKLQTFDLGFSSPPELKQILQNIPEIISYKITGSTKHPPLERIDIDIPLLEYKKLLKDRERSLSNNRLTDPHDIKVKIRYHGKSFKAKIRLKGDLSDHWLSQYRMSLRVSLKNGNSILGFNKFSLHKPASRQHPFDQVFSDLVRRTGNLASVHNYVHVLVNGTNWGVMDIEEHMSKEFLEKQKRKDSLIIRIGNDDKGTVNFHLTEEEKYFPIRLSDPHLYLKVYDSDKYLLNSLNRKKMTYIMEEQIKNKSSTIYDSISYGRALITAAVWNDAHPLLFGNSRHYFNPYTLKLEPIITDAISPIPIQTYGFLPRRKLDPFVNNYLYREISQSKEYINSVDRILNNVMNATAYSQKELESYQDYFPLDPHINIAPILKSNNEIVTQYKNQYLLIDDVNQQKNISLSNSVEDLSSDNNDHVQIFHRENGTIEIFNLLYTPVLIKDLFINGSKAFTINEIIPSSISDLHMPVFFKTNLRGIVNDKMEITTSYLGEIHKTPIEPTISFLDHIFPRLPHSNLHPLPTEEQAKYFPKHVHARHYKNGQIKIYNLIDDDVTLLDIIFKNNSVLHNPQTLKAYTHGEYNPLIISTNLEGIFDDQITIKTKYKNNIRTLKIGPTLDNSDIKNPLNISEKAIYPGFIKKTSKNAWIIPAGKWLITSPLVFNGNLLIEQGTTLNFDPDAYIIIKGSLTAKGTQDAPIIMNASHNKWKGIYVINANSVSKLSYVDIQNTKALEDGILALSGGTTFYKSEVTMEHVHLSDSIAEDALNIVESNFYLNNVIVNNTVSDGIDFDFSAGKIMASNFANIGGDALDFSGSNVKGRDLTMNNIKDKAMSVGEATSIYVNNIDINTTGAGIVSKDGSIVKGSNIKVYNYLLGGIMSYMKKTFYSPPKIKLENVDVAKNKNAYLRQIDSEMYINGNLIPSQPIDVDNLYNTATMKK